MNAVEYIKIAIRMCADYDEFITKAKEYASTIEQCGNEHTEKPSKTRQSEFLKQLAENSINEDDGILKMHPCIIEKGIKCAGKNCDECRREYWLTEVADND